MNRAIMQTTRVIAMCVPLLGLWVGCVPDFSLPDVLNLPWLAPADASDVGGSGGAVQRPVGATSFTVAGEVIGKGMYQLYELGPALTGEQWSLSADLYAATGFTVVLFDDNYDMLARGIVRAGNPLSHVLREDVATLRVGVAPTSTSNGGAFSFRAALTGTTGVPAPRTQVVYLDFGGAAGLTVHSRRDIAFGPFNSGLVGDAYANDTEYFCRTIVDEVRRDYAGYDVIVWSSLDGPPPAAVHSVVHFGADGRGLLGLADSVDQYNVNLNQRAIVFTNSFSLYSGMRLSARQMAQIMPNTASHELGHLWGLYHTADPQHLMDTTGNVWDLVANQQFQRAPLEPTVFPYGQQNTPKLLTQIVGLNAATAEAAKGELLEKALDRKMVRDLLASELPCRCGNCLNPDE